MGHKAGVMDGLVYDDSQGTGDCLWCFYIRSYQETIPMTAILNRSIDYEELIVVKMLTHTCSMKLGIQSRASQDCSAHLAWSSRL